MSGHAGDVVATDTQVSMALQAILRQLATTGIADNYDSMSHALTELNMWEFIHNQAAVVASLHAFSVRDNAIIHKLTMAGAYVKLDGVLD